MRRGKRLNAVLTVEMSFIMPLILSVVLTCVLSLFYYHDKNILSGAAYETAVVGSTKVRVQKEGELQRLFQERARGKCILFATPQADIQVTDTEIRVLVSASKGRMRLSVAKCARITKPEKYIRDIRRVT